MAAVVDATPGNSVSHLHFRGGGPLVDRDRLVGRTLLWMVLRRLVGMDADDRQLAARVDSCQVCRIELKTGGYART